MIKVPTRESEHMNKPVSYVKIAIIALVVVICAALLGSHLYYQNRFKATDIDGVNVSGLTVAQATKKLNNRDLANDKDYLIVPGSKVTLTQKDVGKLFVTRSSMSMFTSKKLTTETTLSKSEINYRLKTLLPKFKQQLVTINAKKTPTIDAQVILDNDKISVKKGIQGNSLDTQQMVANFKKQAKTQTIIAVKRVKKIAGGPNSKQVAAEKKHLQSIDKNKLVLQMPNSSFTFLGKDYLKTGHSNNDGSYTFSDNLVAKQVKQLAAKYNTLGKSFKIKSHSGQTIKINGATYGWTMNQAKLSKAIVKQLEKEPKSTLSLKPYVTGTGYGLKNNVGDTYVEEDLRTLREYVYYKGHLKEVIPIMSGTITGGNKTPQGAFYILYKQRDAVLRGKNDDGSKYASKVSYWEPITESGVGMHDSPWQPAYVYGNPIYRGQFNSHGCLNNPPSMMPSVWKYTYTFEPVVVYY